VLFQELLGSAAGVHQALELPVGGGDRCHLGVRAVAVRERIVVGEREQHEVEQIVPDEISADAAGVLVAHAGHPELSAAAGLPARIDVGVEQLLRPVDRPAEQGRGNEPGQRGLLRHLVLVAAAVDQVRGPRGTYAGVVERLEDRLHIMREVLGVHPVNGVGQGTHYAELP